MWGGGEGNQPISLPGSHLLSPDRVTEGPGHRSPARIGDLGVRARPDIAQSYPQQEDLETAKSQKQASRIYGTSPGGYFQPQGQICFVLGDSNGKGKNGAGGWDGVVSTTIVHKTCRRDRDKAEVYGKGNSRPCLPPRSGTTQSRTGEMTFNVGLCYQPRQSAIVQCSTRRGLRGTKSRDKQGPPPTPLPPGRTLALPHTRTHADHTYTAQTHARVPTVKYIYRGTLIYIHRERET